MKLRTLIMAGALALSACSKPNDVATLREEGGAITKYNAPTLALYQKRGDAAIERMRNLPPSQPGYADAMHALEDGRQKYGELKGLEGSFDKVLEKETSVTSLEKLVQDTSEKYEEYMTMIDDDLNAVEAWIARTEDALAHTTAMAAPAPAAPPEAEPAPAAEPSKADMPKEPAKAAPAEPKKEPAKAEPKKAETKTPEPKKATEPAKKPAEPKKP